MLGGTEVFMDTQIQLKQLTEEDLNLLVQWFKAPHVAEWWVAESLLDEQALKEKYRAYITSQRMNARIICLGQRPMGYIQFYGACKSDGNYWWQEPEGTYSMDLFIGEPDCLCKGYGTTVSRQVCALLFERPEVIRLIIDPDPRNERAIRCYQKVGFLHVGPCETPEGTHLLMELTRDRWCELSKAAPDHA